MIHPELVDQHVLVYLDVVAAGRISLTNKLFYTRSKDSEWVRRAIENGGVPPRYRLTLWAHLTQTRVLYPLIGAELDVRSQPSANHNADLSYNFLKPLSEYEPIKLLNQNTDITNQTRNRKCCKLSESEYDKLKGGCPYARKWQSETETIFREAEPCSAPLSDNAMYKDFSDNAKICFNYFCVNNQASVAEFIRSWHLRELACLTPKPDYDPCIECREAAQNSWSDSDNMQSLGQLPDEMDDVNADVGNDSDSEANQGDKMNRYHEACGIHRNLFCGHLKIDDMVIDCISNEQNEIPVRLQNTSSSYDKEPLFLGEEMEREALHPRVLNLDSCNTKRQANYDSRIPAYWEDDEAMENMGNLMGLNATRQDSAPIINRLDTLEATCTCCSCCRSTANPDIDDYETSMRHDDRSTHIYSRLCYHSASGLWSGVGRWLMNPEQYTSAQRNDGAIDDMVSPVYAHCHHQESCEVQSIRPGIAPYTVSDVLIYEYLVDESCVKISKKLQDEISRDITRTFPHLPNFSKSNSIGQRTLYKLLSALAVANPDVVYCQGINFIAAVLLSISGCPVYSFWTMISIYRHFDCQLLFASDVPLLKSRLHQISAAIRKASPRIWAIFRRMQMEPSFLMQQWILTLFSYCLDPFVLEQIWDSFFISGWSTLIRTCLAVLIPVDKYISQHLEADEIVQTLHNRSFPFRCHVPIDNILQTNENVKSLTIGEMWNPMLVAGRPQKFRSILAIFNYCTVLQSRALINTGKTFAVDNEMLVDVTMDRLAEDVEETFHQFSKIANIVFKGSRQHISHKSPKIATKKKAIDPFDPSNILRGVIVNFVGDVRCDGNKAKKNSKSKLLLWIDMKTYMTRDWPLQEVPAIWNISTNHEMMSIFYDFYTNDVVSDQILSLDNLPNKLKHDLCIPLDGYFGLRAKGCLFVPKESVLRKAQTVAKINKKNSGWAAPWKQIRDLFGKAIKDNVDIVYGGVNTDTVTPISLPNVVRHILFSKQPEDTRMNTFAPDMTDRRPLCLSVPESMQLQVPASVTGGSCHGRYMVLPIVAFVDLYNKLEDIHRTITYTLLACQRWFTRHKKVYLKLLVQYKRLVKMVDDQEDELASLLSYGSYTTSAVCSDLRVSPKFNVDMTPKTTSNQGSRTIGFPRGIFDGGTPTPDRKESTGDMRSPFFDRSASLDRRVRPSGSGLLRTKTLDAKSSVEGGSEGWKYNDKPSEGALCNDGMGLKCDDTAQVKNPANGDIVDEKSSADGRGSLRSTDDDYTVSPTGEGSEVTPPSQSMMKKSTAGYLTHIDLGSILTSVRFPRSTDRNTRKVASLRASIQQKKAAIEQIEQENCQLYAMRRDKQTKFRSMVKCLHLRRQKMLRNFLVRVVWTYYLPPIESIYGKMDELAAQDYKSWKLPPLRARFQELFDATES